jgi:hypothetical protein
MYYSELILHTNHSLLCNNMNNNLLPLPLVALMIMTTQPENVWVLFQRQVQGNEVCSGMKAANIEPWCNIYCLFSLSLRFWRFQYRGGMNQKRPTAIQGTMNCAETSFGTEICAGAIISLVQYLAPLRYMHVTFAPYFFSSVQ